MQGPVVYAAFEGQSGVWYRLQAIKKYHNGGQDFNNLVVCLENMVFGPNKNRGKQKHVQFIQSIKAECAQAQPVLVILDTLAQSIDGDENESIPMTFYARAAREIGDEFGCFVLIVHHPNAENTKPRGHTSLAGTCDCQIKVWTNKKRTTVTNQVEFTKDGPPSEPMPARLVKVDIESDEEGNPIKSCVLVPEAQYTDEYAPVSNVDNKERPVYSHLRKMAAALAPLMREDGTADYPGWREKCLDMDLYGKKRDRQGRRASFNNRVKQMIDLDLVEVIYATVNGREEGLSVRLTDKGMVEVSKAAA
jgi:hypothetical protein